MIDSARLHHTICQSPAELDAWDEFVVGLSGAHYLQLYGWLSSYEAMGFVCQVMLQRAGDRIVGGAAFLSTSLPLGLGRIFVLPHGPILRDPAPEAWDALMTALDEHFRRLRAVFVQAWPRGA